MALPAAGTSGILSEPVNSVTVHSRSSNLYMAAVDNKAQIELAELERPTTSFASNSRSEVERAAAENSTVTVQSIRSSLVEDIDITNAKRRKYYLQFVTLCWTYFLTGWNDGTIGPLLPRIQRVYHVRTYTAPY